MTIYRGGLIVPSLIKILRFSEDQMVKELYLLCGEVLVVVFHICQSCIFEITNILKGGLFIPETSLLITHNFLFMVVEPFSCLFQLKSAKEDTEGEQGSAICLCPGSGDYHVL